MSVQHFLNASPFAIPSSLLRALFDETGGKYTSGGSVSACFMMTWYRLSIVHGELL
jgi:hypothetical protein